MSFADVIAKTAMHAVQPGSSLTTGFVTEIHNDPSDDLFGTVDVQEYNDGTTEDEDYMQGFHQGVRLGPILNIKNGYTVIPKLYSDVVIATDPIDNEEYIILFSQVDIMKLEGGTTVSVGVIEREAHKPGGGKTIDQMDVTGNQSWTEYTKGTIHTQVINEDGAQSDINITPAETKLDVSDGDKKASVSIKKDSLSVSVGDDVKIVASNNDISISSKNSEVSINGSKVVINAQNIEITGGNVTMKGTAAPNQQGPFCAIPVCPFSGAPHSGSMVSGT